MTKVSELVSQNVGNQIINSQTWASLIYNVKNPAYAAKGDGTTNDTVGIAAAITAATATGGIVMFPPGTYITANQTVPSNVTLWFANGAKLSINTGATITINGYVEAGMYQIFSGLGTVIGKMTNDTWFPQWWGAKADNVNDDAPAINALIAAAQAGSYQAVIKLPAALYKINSSIIIKHGTVQQNINIEAYGARLVAGTAGMTMIKIVAYGAPAGFANNGLTRLKGIRLYGTGDSGSTGIYAGKSSSSATDYPIDGVFPSVLQDITIENVQYGVILSSARLWKLENVTSSGGFNPSTGILIQSLYDGYCGDHWIIDCQVGSSTNGIGLQFTASSGTGTSKISGVHVRNSVFYGQAVNINASNSPSVIQDIWITSCVADGTNVGNGINITGVSGTSVDHIFITDPWINGFQIGLNMDYTSAVITRGGKMSSTNFAAIVQTNSSDNLINGVLFNDINKSGNGGGMIKIGAGGNRNKVIGCNFTNTTPYGNQIITIDATQVKPIVTHNVKDSAGAVYVNSVAGVEGTAFIMAGNL